MYKSFVTKGDIMQQSLLSQKKMFGVKKGESYLAEQFRQIGHYLAEHLIQWKVLDFKNAGIQKYANMQVCK